MVVPRSWKRHHQLTERIYATPRPPADDQQFLMLPANDPILFKPRRPHLVKARAGDAILWDSRTVHCSTPAQRPPQDRDTSTARRPLRVAVYGSMVPRARASADVLRARQDAALRQQTCTHWPFEMSCLPTPADSGQVPSDPQPRFGAIEKQLIGFTDEQISTWMDGNADGPLKQGRESATPGPGDKQCPAKE